MSVLITLPCITVLCTVYADGSVCISILHTPGDDPLGYETAAERWSPVQSIEKILLSVISMLAGELTFLHDILSLSFVFSEPNDESGANVDASVSQWMYDSLIMIIFLVQKMWRENRRQFNDIAQRLVRKSLGL